MSSLTLYYCSFCEAVSRTMAKLINYCETVGTYRAASELARQGFHKEAKALITQQKED